MRVKIHGERGRVHDLYGHLMVSHADGNPHAFCMIPDEELPAIHAEEHRIIRNEQRRAEMDRPHCPGCRCVHPEDDR